MERLEADSLGKDALCSAGALVGSFIGVISCAGLNVNGAPGVLLVATCGVLGCFFVNLDLEEHLLKPAIIGTVSTLAGSLVGGTIGALSGGEIGFWGMLAGGMLGGIIGHYIARQKINDF